MPKPRRRATLATVALVALLVPTARPAASAQPMVTEAPYSTGELWLAPDAPGGSVTGAFSEGAHFVEFHSREDSPGRSRAQLSVNGKRFSIARDMATGIATWGGGGQVLVPEDRAVARALLDELQHEWVRPAKARGEFLAPDRDLLARLAMLVSEVPLGEVVGNQQVHRPALRSQDADGRPERPVLAPPSERGGIAASRRDRSADRCIAEVVPGIARDLNQPTVSAEVASLAAAQCQVADDNGIWYFNCQSLNRALCHDTRGHCWLCESVFSGPRSANCMGECGPGCNGLNIYTYDCGDHDRCARVHGGALNPWDADCGDEYWDADDDFIWGWPNCW